MPLISPADPSSWQRISSSGQYGRQIDALNSQQLHQAEQHSPLAFRVLKSFDGISCHIHTIEHAIKMSSGGARGTRKQTHCTAMCQGFVFPVQLSWSAKQHNPDAMTVQIRLSMLEHGGQALVNGTQRDWPDARVTPIKPLA